MGVFQGRKKNEFLPGKQPAFQGFSYKAAFFLILIQNFQNQQKQNNGVVKIKIQLFTQFIKIVKFCFIQNLLYQIQNYHTRKHIYKIKQEKQNEEIFKQIIKQRKINQNSQLIPKGSIKILT
ncbi:hypothetical protein ABPG73_003753 [Tetrahymena malaccensis]